jgi:hypothetical protein
MRRLDANGDDRTRVWFPAPSLPVDAPECFTDDEVRGVPAMGIFNTARRLDTDENLRNI